MTDLLVPLQHLSKPEVPQGFWIGRPLPHQAPIVLRFVEDSFGEAWAAETQTAFSSVPPTVLVAVEERTGIIAGFCCWDCTARGFLGPVGVGRGFRKQGVGEALVLDVLCRMREAGYGYAVIGGVGPSEFFRRICDARVIRGSDPGIYGNPISNGS